jgi:hypothetical protein
VEGETPMLLRAVNSILAILCSGYMAYLMGTGIGTSYLRDVMREAATRPQNPTIEEMIFLIDDAIRVGALGAVVVFIALFIALFWILPVVERLAAYLFRAMTSAIKRRFVTLPAAHS